MASTFANNTAYWRVRPGGSANNGGGFDPLVTNAGTDYTDQDTPQTSGTTGTVTAASTTFVDASAAFTAAMIGNVMQIRSATGGGAGAVDYYVITAFTSATTVTLDRSPASGSNITACTWAVGGAFATLSNLALTSTGTLPAPATPAPLLIGNTVYVRGAGSLFPNADDYDWSGGTWTFVGNSPIITNGITTNLITLVGYNGRPRIAHAGQVINAGTGGGSPTSAGWDAKHVYFRRKLNTNNTPAITYSGAPTSVPMRVMDCVFDQNGFDAQEYAGIGGGFDYNYVFSTGASGAGTVTVIAIDHPGCSCVGNYINGVKGPAIGLMYGASSITTTHPVIAFNHIVNCLSDGITLSLQNASTLYNCVVVHNTLDNNAGNGVVIGTTVMSYLSMFNNIFSNHTTAGKSALAFTDSKQINIQLQKNIVDANCYYNNTTDFGSTPGWAYTANDVQANPGYVNAGGGNYKTGANVNGKGLSGLGGVAGTIGAATNKWNIGAYQGVAAASGLFRQSLLAGIGAGGAFFQNPIN